MHGVTDAPTTARALRGVSAGVVCAVAVLGGCSVPVAGSSPTSTQTASVPVTPTIPSDGVSLRALGFVNGPSTAFSIPQGSVLTTRIDHDDVVTLVFAAPAGSELEAYFTDALPKAGFTIKSSANDAITFTGYGWDGSFVAAEESGVTLRRS